MRRIVALFDDRAQAEAAQRDLARAGIATQNSHLSGSPGSQEDRGFWSGLRDFFTGEENDIYTEAQRRGGVLLTIDIPDDRVDQAVNVVERHDPIDIDRKSAEWQSQGWKPSATTTEEKTIPVVQEQLKVGKRREQRGGVRIYTDVKETPVKEQVKLREEEVHVERHKVDRPAGDDAFRQQSIEATTFREEPVVKKEARVVEEVAIKKNVKDRTETVEDTVRKTEVQVEELDKNFRNDYQQRFANSGFSYDQVRPAYDYGRQLAGDTRYRDRDWSAVESEARRGWEKTNPGMWDRFHPAIRRGYDEARKYVQPR